MYQNSQFIYFAEFTDIKDTANETILVGLLYLVCQCPGSRVVAECKCRWTFIYSVQKKDKQ